jgi:virulence-associated protein VapD
MASARVGLQPVEIERPYENVAVSSDRMHAIAFDMDIAEMERAYGNPNRRKGYSEIGDILLGHGFDDHKQGSVYFGDRERVTAVSCVIAVQDLARQLPWFSASVRDIRMLRIEEEDDLKVALEKVPTAPATESLFSVVQDVEQ